MATFYLLPPRPHLGKQFGELLAHLFPGLTWPDSTWNDLAEALGAAAQVNGDRYVVFAEDLPDQLPLDDALALHFGAEPGDEIYSVRAARRLGEVQARRWVFGAAAKKAA
jgi:hypothetical protein